MSNRSEHGTRVVGERLYGPAGQVIQRRPCGAEPIEFCLKRAQRPSASDNHVQSSKRTACTSPTGRVRHPRESQGKLEFSQMMAYTFGTPITDAPGRIDAHDENKRDHVSSWGG